MIRPEVHPVLGESYTKEVTVLTPAKFYLKPWASRARDIHCKYPR
jgi:hypothetical protein